jgi:hypothetical protein
MSKAPFSQSTTLAGLNFSRSYGSIVHNSLGFKAQLNVRAMLANIQAGSNSWLIQHPVGPTSFTTVEESLSSVKHLNLAERNDTVVQQCWPTQTVFEHLAWPLGTTNRRRLEFGINTFINGYVELLVFSEQ